jgi:hypothetical protein
MFSSKLILPPMYMPPGNLQEHNQRKREGGRRVASLKTRRGRERQKDVIERERASRRGIPLEIGIDKFRNIESLAQFKSQQVKWE